jgi:hypothetical protein
MKKFLPVVFIIGVIIVFFWQFLLKGLLPIPSDTIVGLYYPFREIYFKTNPNGVPYKNFLVTDPVRQQIPWKNLVVEAEKNLTLPIWNPYNFAGTPLLANLQSGAFYPTNLLFLLLPFSMAWSLIILLEPLLAGLFLYLYLRNLKLNQLASFLGAITFAFCGFSVAWLEWGSIISTALWLPLILLAIDKIFEVKAKHTVWFFTLVFSLTFAFFAGHLQTFFYLGLLAICYLIFRWLRDGHQLKKLGLFLTAFFLVLVLSLPQLIPTLNFILLSARNVDLPGWTQAGWFIPWQNLIQFVAPDFFGNPATLNYYGVWNYGEFIGYIGIVPLIVAFFALFFRRDKPTFFFGTALFLSLIFALPTIFAKLPYKFDLPFISTAQPTRLLFIADFSLSILAALGIDILVSTKNKKYILIILAVFAVLFAGLWSFVLLFHGNILSAQNLSVAKQNLIFPTLLFILSAALLSISAFIQDKKITIAVLVLLIALTVFDLFRFGWKFEPFTNQNYLFPSTSVTTFLKSQAGPFRVMATDSKIFPPNFSSVYNLQTLDGYDPLYLLRFGELMAASARGVPNINTPFGFNRIITPQDPLSRTTDLLNVKYVLSLEAVNNPKLKLVFDDGTVKAYENEMAMPRAFFVNTTYLANSKQDAITAMFDLNYPLDKRATVENVSNKNLFKSNWDLGQAQITDYQNDKVTIDINNPGEGFLVLTDSFYPTWHATIDGKPTTIYLTDYNFRGIITPKGKHMIQFYDSLF